MYICILKFRHRRGCRPGKPWSNSRQPLLWSSPGLHRISAGTSPDDSPEDRATADRAVPESGTDRDAQPHAAGQDGTQWIQ